jgi:photosystem II stability/assembly factor-like uncharacterized protein
MIIAKKYRAAALALICTAYCARAASQWQGGTLAAADRAESETRGSEFLVLDTGGSGGMFLKGDLRHDLRDVDFWTDGRHGVACSRAGVFYTRDGGLTWTRIRKHLRDDYPDDKGLLYDSVELAAPEEIWVSEGKHPSQGRGLWHSTDGGATWEDVSPRFPGAYESAWGLLARGEQVWVLGGWTPDASYRSDDGGATWRRLGLPEGLQPFHAVTPADGPRGRIGTVYVLGARRDEDGRRRPELWRTDDAGSSWNRVSLPTIAVERWQLNRDRIAFATAQHGMISLPAEGFRRPRHGVYEAAPGAAAGVIVTSDGGKTWEHRRLPNGEFQVTALWQDPTNPNHAFAGVLNGFQAQHGLPRQGPALYETFDAGRSWIVVVRGTPQINAITGLDAHRVWAVGNMEGFTQNDVVAILTEPGRMQKEAEALDDI